MRYFFFTYWGDSGDGKYTIGNLWLARESMPSNAEIKNIAMEKAPNMSIVVTGWQEFNNEEDFLNFGKQEG